MTEKTTPASSEFPDEAGYPDGTGTLHEGSTAAADDIVDAIEPFDEGDDRDS